MPGGQAALGKVPALQLNSWQDVASPIYGLSGLHVRCSCSPKGVKSKVREGDGCHTFLALNVSAFRHAGLFGLSQSARGELKGCWDVWNRLGWRGFEISCHYVRDQKQRGNSQWLPQLALLCSLSLQFQRHRAQLHLQRIITRGPEDLFCWCNQGLLLKGKCLHHMKTVAVDICVHGNWFLLCKTFPLDNMDWNEILEILSYKKRLWVFV